MNRIYSQDHANISLNTSGSFLTNKPCYRSDLMNTQQSVRPISLHFPAQSSSTTTTTINGLNTTPPFNNAQRDTKIVPMKIETPSSPPVTPLSKKSAEYSIEALLKHTTSNTTTNHTTCDEMKDAAVVVTPPQSLTPPQSPQHKHLSNAKYNDQIQQSLLRILETAISRMYLTPAFRLLNNELKCKLLERTWFHLFLFGVFEVNFPLESLNLYTQNMIKLNPNQAQLFALNKMDFGLRKLFEHNIDDTELAFLKDMAVFHPGMFDFD